jgi:hypothetical protein
MAAFLQFAFFAAVLVAAYFFWIRPILRSRPAFAEFYTKAESFWPALRERFAGIKGKLAAAIGMAASAVVYLNDFLVPVATGIDWQPILTMLPDWAWPLILLGLFALIKWFRALTDRRAFEER